MNDWLSVDHVSFMMVVLANVRNVVVLWSLSPCFHGLNVLLVSGKLTTLRVNEEILNTLIKAAIAHEADLTAKVAAAVVRRGKVLSIGFNYKKSDPLQKRFSKNAESVYLHAEIHAIKLALKEISVEELSKCDIYIARVKRPRPRSSEWIWGLAKPCEGCSRAITEFDIKNVVYTTDEQTYEVISFPK